MNKTQKTILLVTATIIVLMLLFPPWAVHSFHVFTIESGEVVMHGRSGTNYSLWFTDPPAYRPLIPAQPPWKWEWGWWREPSRTDNMRVSYNADHVAWDFLFIQLAVTVVIGGVLCVLARNASPGEKREDDGPDDTA